MVQLAAATEFTKFRGLSSEEVLEYWYGSWLSPIHPRIRLFLSMFRLSDMNPAQSKSLTF
jgi:hypothetical protein